MEDDTNNEPIQPRFVVPDPDEAPKVRITNLLESTGASKEEIEKLRETWYKEALRKLFWYRLIVSRGGNIHKVDKRAVAKRRSANRVARKQRKVNRDRARTSH